MQIHSITRGHLLRIPRHKIPRREGGPCDHSLLRLVSHRLQLGVFRAHPKPLCPWRLGSTPARSSSPSLGKPSPPSSLPLPSPPLRPPRLAAAPPSLLLLRVAAAPPPAARSFAARSAPSSLDDPNPDWAERPPGCDLEHWLVVMEKPEGDPTRDDIIDSYIKTLAQVVGSEEEARMKIYSVSTRHYYAFGALVSEELSHKLKDLPRVRWVLPDSYLDDKNKDYGGEPFVNGQAVPYDPKYHEGRERNITPANKRNTIICLPSIFDRSSNFERKRENMQSRDFQGRDMPPMHNQGLQNPPPQGNMPPPNMGGGMAPPSNFGGMPLHNQGGMPQTTTAGCLHVTKVECHQTIFVGCLRKTTWVECCHITTWVDRCQITWVRCHLRAIWERDALQQYGWNAIPRHGGCSERGRSQLSSSLFTATTSIITSSISLVSPASSFPLSPISVVPHCLLARPIISEHQGCCPVLGYLNQCGETAISTCDPCNWDRKRITTATTTKHKPNMPVKKICRRLSMAALS
ncbi:hypothetical protein NL676_028550 [Syzygium grande]|nr:hypothetical protein NL676_028550 [Syzygium grande]